MEQLSLQIESIKDVRESIDTTQRKACTAFIEIGYILRKADDAQLYKEMGYKNIFAFARHEYGWDQSQTSRFMAINKEYSVGGYSCALIEKFEGYGQTKLAEMLRLPDNLREEIETCTKRDDIRDIKNEHREAEQDRQKEDFEHSFAPAQQGSLLGRVIKTLFGQDAYAEKIPGLWEYMLREDNGESINAEDIRQILAPSGYGHARAGSCMVFLKKDEIVIARGDEKESYGYGEVLHAVVHLSEFVELDTPSNWYLMVYGKELPQARIKEGAKTGENNESPLGNPVSEKAEKPPRIEGESGQKKEEKCGSATSGIQEQSADDEKLDKAAVESGENNESPLGGQPIEGQERSITIMTQLLRDAGSNRKRRNGIAI